MTKIFEHNLRIFDVDENPIRLFAFRCAKIKPSRSLLLFHMLEAAIRIDPGK
jgi:hypothetical protein